MGIYICATIIICLLMIAMTIHVITYSGFDRVQKTWYVLTFIAIIFCSVAELIVHFGYYDSKYAIILTIMTVIQFSLSPFLAVLFSGALGLHEQAKKASWFFIPSFIIEVALAPFGLIFYFNDEGYFRGDYFIIYEIIYIVSLIYLVFSLIRVGRKFSHRDFWTIFMIVIVLLGGIIPMTFFKLNVAYISIGISSCLCYIYYNDLIQQDTKADLVKNQKKISDMQSHIISSLANLIENRDTETGEHVARTSKYVRLLATYARDEGVYKDEINEEFIERLYALAPLHDVGKIVVSDRLLLKPARLTEEEYEEIKKHASEGGTVIKQILSGVTDDEYLSFASDIATYHHERWDGTGYPKGLKGEEIPLSARIMAIADVYDALVSLRCYKLPISPDEAFLIIEEKSGNHFDPKLVEVFMKHKDEFR